MMTIRTTLGLGKAVLPVALLALTTACGSEFDDGFEDGESGGNAGAGGQLGGSGPGGGEVGGAGGGTAEGGAAPEITIRFRSSTAPFPHADGLSGQTPLSHVSGVRKLQLYQSPTDPNPLTVFDFGSDFVEVSYADGADTPVHTVPASSLPAGLYTMARVVHSHVRYEVASTMHVNGQSLPGTFDNLQVLSDGTLVEGQLRNHGYYEYVFSTGNVDFPISGDDAPVPEWSETGGFSTKLENGEWSYYFPVELVLTPEVTEDIDIVLDVNMHESFRWQDQSEPGFAPDVFDTVPTAFEPVKRFGANDFALSLEPAAP
ncbi:MAG: hypothetical protein JRI68_11855 [Deltaproteobacteria bacterium]|nr:hypothetical protein [Deltaproteobacteria bacterium]